MPKNLKILVLGATGLVGSAISRQLKHKGYNNVLCPTRSELDLFNQANVMNYFEKNQPDWVFFAAAKVGGVYANNTYPADFLWENLSVAVNVFQAAHNFNTKKLLFLGSSCIYPRGAKNPIVEEELLQGSLEPTNQGYALAKISGLMLASYYNQQYGHDFFSCMPTNLYGPGDNFHPENSHVIPGLVSRFWKAKNEDWPEIKIWGTGTPLREFLFVDDAAEACVFLMEHPGPIKGHVNIGSGQEISIKDLAHLIAKKIQFDGNIVFDSSMPDGNPRKLLNSGKINELGWKAKTSLDQGLDKLIDYYVENHT